MTQSIPRHHDEGANRRLLLVWLGALAIIIATFIAYLPALSAGSPPAGFVHVLAVDALRHLHIPLGTLESKSWDVFRDTRVDAVITLCDAAVAQECPVWPGTPIVAHWPLPDPALHPGAADERVDFAIAVAKRLRHKVQAMIDLDWPIPHDQLGQRLQTLGEI